MRDNIKLREKMKCPICSAESIVKDVRDRNDYRIRRRECKNGHFFSSYEIPDERMTELLNFEKTVKKVQSLIEEYA